MTSLDVLPVVLELEAQVDQAGWDNGVGVWGLHTHEDDQSDLTPHKLGGPDYADAHPLEVLQHILPPPPCFSALVMSFECWTSPNKISPAHTDPDRIDTRFVVAALRTGVVWVVEHLRDHKPRAYMLDPVRALQIEGVADVSMAMRRLVMSDDPGLSPGLVGLIRSIIGDGPVEGGGFIILGGAG